MNSVGGILMWDRDNAEILPDNFETVIKQFKNSSSFMIRLILDSDSSSSTLAQVILFAYCIVIHFEVLHLL